MGREVYSDNLRIANFTPLNNRRIPPQHRILDIYASDILPRCDFSFNHSLLSAESAAPSLGLTQHSLTIDFDDAFIDSAHIVAALPRASRQSGTFHTSNHKRLMLSGRHHGRQG